MKNATGHAIKSYDILFTYYLPLMIILLIMCGILLILK